MVTVASGRNKNTLESEVGYKKVRNYLIPNEWDLIKLGDISTKVGSGKTPRGGEAVYQKSGIPFIRSQNVLNNRLELNGISYISESIHDEMKSTKVIPNDVLLNITGASIGRCCIVPDSFKEGNLNQHVCIIRTKDTLDRNYLVNILLSPIGQNQIMNNQAGGNREGLNFDQIRKFDIPLPPLKEQQKIASILSTWDKAIELKEKLIEQKKEQKKGLMQKLLTGEVRLPGFDGRWQQVRLGKLTKLQGGYAFKSAEFVQQGIPIIRISNIDPEITDTNQDFVYYDEIGISDSFKVNYGDILIAMSGATTGKVGLYKKREIAYLNQRVGKFVILDKSKLDYSFLYHLIMSSMFKLQLKEELATGAQPNISSRQIENFKFKIPSLDEQKKISKTLNQIDRSINLQEKEIALLKHQKQGLMQLLLTGKVRVKV